VGKDEEDVEIRKRLESRLKRTSGYLLAIILSGILISGKGLTKLMGASSLLVILVLYLLFENYIIRYYEKHTDELIRKKKE